MELPGPLRTAIQNGSIPLLLGPEVAGEAKDSSGKHPPRREELATLMAEKFLDGECKNEDLSRVAEYAMSEQDPVTVQEFIRETYTGYLPARTHSLLPKLRWHGIATTTYDRYVEEAYAKETGAQTLVEFIDNSDRVSEKLRNPSSLPFLKLHGCISRTNSKEYPLILTTDQSLQYRQCRNHLFNMFADWAREMSVVFLGYEFEDDHFRKILLDLDAETPSRPRYYMVAQNVPGVVERHWEKRNIRVLQGSPQEFLEAAIERCGGAFQGITRHNESSHRISSRFIRPSDKLSEEGLRFLSVESDYVNGISPDSGTSAKEFYHGTDPGWFAIQNGWDVRRRLADDIVLQHVLAEEHGETERPSLVVIKAHAGAGKSVLLRRLAWDIANEYDAISLFLHPHGSLSAEAVDEIVQLCGERVFIFVDDAQRRPRDIERFICSDNAPRRDVTVVTAARTNEWNVSCPALSPYVTDEFELTPLSEKEVVELLNLLEKNNALGALAAYTPEERLQKFVQDAGRQLLVALHETTLGKPFEDIIRDEYERIRPEEAQQIYLTICVLNRLNIPVRAGIVSRLHDINFEEFSRRFFSPLERVVRTAYDPIIRDHTYHARHPEIAQMVFNQVLRDQQAKFSAYKECLGQLNIAYDADERAFEKMIRGRSMLEMFPDHQLVEQIYAVATKQGGSELHLSHQKAVYEMNRPGGDLIEAKQLLEKSLALSAGNFAVRHSMSELHLRLAERSTQRLERKRHLDEAVSKARAMLGRSRDSRPYVTIAKANRMRLNDFLASEHPGDETGFSSLINEAENNIEQGLQRFPGDSFLLKEESEIAQQLENSSRALTALTTAFANDPSNGLVANRLANCLVDSGDLGSAEETLFRAINANNSNQRLHFAYAKLLMSKESPDRDTVLAHLRKSFAPGDKNYDAQLCYASQLYHYHQFERATEEFRTLRNAQVPFEIRTQVRYREKELFSGAISGLEASYAFIKRDGAGDAIYAHISNSDGSSWEGLRLGTRVKFHLGYSMRGPSAVNVHEE